jgi:Porin subfamily
MAATTMAFRFACGLVIIVAMTSGAGTSRVTAQTLTDPNPGTKNTRLPDSKSAGTKQPQACPEFGAGFVRMPGSDTCIKIGGSVDVDVVGRNH